ncbi:MAG: outer membrane beta-barrel protein [Rhodocyclales bacterium]|jgi:hypothetical protein|nr:outer membrane beta-barrel protein [Rhodocyclales bacterium]
MKKIVAIAALSLATSLPAAAADYNNSGHFLLGMGLTFGGDTLVTLHYTDGSTSSIKSGGLVHIYGGYEYRFSNRVSVQANVGYHVDDENAKNGSVKFSRYPLELLGYYGITDNVRLGGGLRYVTSPKVSGSGVVDSADFEFNNATGLVVEGEYLISPQFGVKLRAVSEKYKLKDGSASANGNHGGIYASYYF